jgi:hypothetical protein
MKTSKLALILAVLYLLLTGFVIAGELHTRIYNTANSEFAGMISIGLTLPTSLLMAWLLSSITGTQLGDSNAAFVIILGSAAIVNAVLIYFLCRTLSRLFSSSRK